MALLVHIRLLPAQVKPGSDEVMEIFRPLVKSDQPAV